MNSSSSNYYKYWGKVKQRENSEYCYHLLPYHCLDVAAVVDVLLDEIEKYKILLTNLGFCKGEPARAFILFLAGIHDIGKFSESFQNLEKEILFLLQNKRSDKKYLIRHDQIGFSWCEDLLFDQLLKIDNFPFFRFDPEFSSYNWWKIMSPLFSASLCHHGEPKNYDSKINGLSTIENFQDMFCYVREVALLFFSPLSQQPTFFSNYDNKSKRTSHLSWLLAGVIILADWIASSSKEEYFSFRSEIMDLQQYYQISKELARRIVRSIEITDKEISPFKGFKPLFPLIKKPTNLQLCTVTCKLGSGPNLVFIEDLCGSGKTEAAIVLSHRMMQHGAKGLFFALPTMATANAMYKRMKKFYKHLYKKGADPTILLTHSASKVMKDIRILDTDFIEPFKIKKDESVEIEANYWLSDSRKKALLSNIGIGTIDQALMSILPLKHQSLRIAGLCRNVLIVDEVHSYDNYMLELLQGLISFQAALGGNTILISATLPKTTRNLLAKAFTKVLKIEDISVNSNDYPLLTILSEETQHEPEYPIDRLPENKQELIIEIVSDINLIYKRIEEVINNGLCVAWIRNTVRDAVESFTKLQQIFPKERVKLFHARYTLCDRLLHENEVIRLFGETSCLSERKGLILVATQVIEQSIDVDFDLMITDLAPVDLLIQRAGRVHRHNIYEPYRSSLRGPAKLIIYAPPLIENPDIYWFSRMFPAGSKVYEDHGNLYLTLSTLAKREKLIFPDDIRTIVDEVYNERSIEKIPAGLIKSTYTMKGKNLGDKAIGRRNRLSLDSGYIKNDNWDDESTVSTRLSELSQAVWFGFYQEGRMVPIYGSGRQGWYLSQVMLPMKKISKSASEKEIKDAIKSELPGRGRFGILVIMERDGDNWIGSGWTDDGSVVRIVYNKITGVFLQK